MTYDDDYIQLDLPGAPRRASCKSLGLDWPPPDKIQIGDTRWGIGYERVSMSEITDEQRAGMTHVCRGALYAIAKANS